MIFQRLSADPITSHDQLEQLLLQRIPEEQRKSFFSFPSPSQLSEDETGIDSESLQRAAERLRQAIENKETVVIYGDYDCDGITATTILWLTLHYLGLNAWPFLPHRERHGYGLSVKGLEEIWQSAQPTLVITVDNGIVATQGIEWLKERGVDVIVTDHHERHESLPPADIIIHSTKLCGATIAWLVANALDPVFAVQLLDLAAIGTIADQVALYGANRSFAVHGLDVLRQGTRPSLRALAEIAGLDLSQATTSTVHFGIAPRLNAMGRLYEAKEALRALVSTVPERAHELMKKLQEANLERQALTQQSADEAFQGIEGVSDESIIVATGNFHEGIIGLIASKLVERTGKPAIVLAIGPEIAKASCRSIPGFHITDFLRGLTAVPYLALGGHAMAAGFSVPSSQIEEVKRAITQAGRKTIDSQLFQLSTPVVGDVSVTLLTRETARLIQRFAPFGAGNEEPVFVLPQIQIEQVRPVGKGGKHAQLRFQFQETPQQAIWFNYQDRGWQDQTKLADIAVSISESTFRGKEIEIQVRGFMPITL